MSHFVLITQRQTGTYLALFNSVPVQLGSSCPDADRNPDPDSYSWKQAHSWPDIRPSSRCAAQVVRRKDKELGTNLPVEYVPRGKDDMRKRQLFPPWHAYFHVVKNMQSSRYSMFGTVILKKGKCKGFVFFFWRSDVPSARDVDISWCLRVFMDTLKFKFVFTFLYPTWNTIWIRIRIVMNSNQM
jgi:hypothetical protein